MSSEALSSGHGSSSAQPGAGDRRSSDGVGRLYSSIASASKYLSFAAILVMMLVMVAEVLLRYFLGQPLGWNISLIEKILLPGLVFLGLPWTYSVGSHVAAELIFNRLPLKVRRVLEWLSTGVLLTCAVAMVCAGTIIAVETFNQGSIPPPLSSQVHISTWVWRTFMPLGFLATGVLMGIDAVRTGSTARSES